MPLSLFIRLVGIAPEDHNDDSDMSVDEDDVPPGHTPTFNIQDEIVRFQVSDPSSALRVPPNSHGKISRPSEKPSWYVLFQATTTRTTRDVVQFDETDGRFPTTTTCLVASQDITPIMKTKLKLLVSPCVAPDVNAIMR